MYFVYLINLRHFVLISLYECVSTKPVVEALCRIVYKTCDLGRVPPQSWSSRVASNTNLGVGNPPENHKLLNTKDSTDTQEKDIGEFGKRDHLKKNVPFKINPLVKRVV